MENGFDIVIGSEQFHLTGKVKEYIVIYTLTHLNTMHLEIRPIGKTTIPDSLIEIPYKTVVLHWDPNHILSLHLPN